MNTWHTRTNLLKEIEIKMKGEFLTKLFNFFRKFETTVSVSAIIICKYCNLRLISLYIQFVPDNPNSCIPDTTKVVSRLC
jgi:hypothetical protein